MHKYESLIIQNYTRLVLSKVGVRQRHIWTSDIFLFWVRGGCRGLKGVEFWLSQLWVIRKETQILLLIKWLNEYLYEQLKSVGVHNVNLAKSKMNTTNNNLWRFANNLTWMSNTRINSRFGHKSRMQKIYMRSCLHKTRLQKFYHFCHAWFFIFI